MKCEIMRCYQEYKPQADDIDLSMMCFTEFGKGLIKQGNISPDAFLQMAIQLANYKVHLTFLISFHHIEEISQQQAARILWRMIFGRSLSAVPTYLKIDYYWFHVVR